MPNKSTALSQAILDRELGQVASTPLTTVYIRLYTVAPTPGTAGTEMSGDTYSAQSFTNDIYNVSTNPTGHWNPATNDGINGIKTNAQIITFPTAVANTWPIVAVAITDSSGNIKCYGPCVLTVQIGQAFTIAAGSLTVYEQ